MSLTDVYAINVSQCVTGTDNKIDMSARYSQWTRDLIQYAGITKGHAITLDDFATHTNGKPYLKNHERLHFNVSHSGEWIVCALSDMPVGVDIEQVVAVPPHMYRDHLAHEEYVALRSLPPYNQNKYFFRLWTHKESYLKMTGDGLLNNPAAIVLTPDRDTFTLRAGGQNTDVHFKEYTIAENYIMTVCAQHNTFGPLTILPLEDLPGIIQHT